MTKISEAIKYYESICPETEFDSYFGDSHAYEKIQTLALMKKSIGDVDLTDDYLKAYMYGLKPIPFYTPYERLIQKVRIIYEISKDADMTVKELIILIELYHAGAYSLMVEEIKRLISTHKDLGSGLLLIRGEAQKYGLEEAEKLNYLKAEYSEKFIEEIQQVVVEECISSDKVLEILPSKEFIDTSEIEIPGLNYTVLSGENLVVRRLKYIGVEDEFQKTPLSEKIILGNSSSGNTVFTSFTKEEYEKELTSKKKVLSKK